jgi:hypothetical protein
MSLPLSKLDALSGLIRSDGVDPKPTLLRMLTDFYVQKRTHSPEENRHFTELALRLIDEVDGATRADIARRLGEHGGAPPIVLQRLTGDRARANTGDAAPTTAKGTGIRNTSPVTRSNLAPASTDRLVITAQDRAAATGFSGQFFAGDSQTRRAILRELDTGAAVTPLGIAAADAVATCRELENAALRSRPYEFVREMERALAIPRTIAEMIVNDVSGEPMLVVAKALGMPTNAVQRILLLVNPAVGNSVRRVFDLTELYEELSSRAALRLISLWRYSEQLPSPNDPAANPIHATGSARRSTAEAGQRQKTEIPLGIKKNDQRAS